MRHGAAGALQRLANQCYLDDHEVRAQVDALLRQARVVRRPASPAHIEQAAALPVSLSSLPAMRGDQLRQSPRSTAFASIAARSSRSAGNAPADRRCPRGDRTQDGQALDEIRQLADVAGPGISRERIQRLRCSTHARGGPRATFDRDEIARPAPADRRCGRAAPASRSGTR